MKKFIVHILLFLLPVMAAATILLALPTDKKRAYHYLTDDCEGRGAWMYQRIFESKEPVDLAFLGSSHTINGINDTLINIQLKSDSSQIQNVCNLGYCRLGRDLTYVLMKHLVEHKGTKVFIIEVLPDEPRLSHPVFPFVADMKDVVNPQTVYNSSYLSNLYNASVSRLMYVRQNLWKEPYINKYGPRGNSGFTTNTFQEDTNALQTKKERRHHKRLKRNNWNDRLNLSLAKAWLATIYSLAKELDLTIAFLYIPPYGSPEATPIQMNTYTKYAPVWIAPDTIFNNPRNWYDHEHLNLNGANSLSTWLALEISQNKLH